MKKLFALSLTSLLAAASAQTVIVQPSASLGLRGTEFGVSAGYAAGGSVEAFVHAPNVAGPVGIKLGVAYTKPSDSIRDDVDISGANSGLTLGTFGSYKADGATESGSHLTVGLDGTYDLGPVGTNLRALGYAGGRYGMFSATENYDDASSTTTSMNAFGVGVGAQLGYRLANGMTLFGDLGVDQYFNGPLRSVKTGANQNADVIPTNDALYASQRARFAFPGTVFKAKIGLKFGGN